MKTFFITGTDTEVGKTYTSCLLASYLANQKKSVIGFKPIAAGAEWIDGQLKNDDALALQQASSMTIDYPLVNPFCFAQPIAPHIAARQARSQPTLDDIRSCYLRLPQADYCLVEGAGGFLVPLNDEESMADIPRVLEAAVILVVGMRLGCVNHALLTVEAITKRKLNFTGWIANRIDPQMSHYVENLDTLKQQLPAPLLAEVDFGQNQLVSDQRF